MWEMSFLTLQYHYQLNYEFVLAPTTENTGSQISPLEEQVITVIESCYWSLMSHGSLMDLKALDKAKQVSPSHYKDMGKRSQEVWWFLLVQILPKWQKQQSYLTSSSIVSFVHLQKLCHPFNFSIQFLPWFTLFFKKKAPYLHFAYCWNISTFTGSEKTKL